MAAIVDEEPDDFYYQDDFYIVHPDDKFSCSICLCPVQREAYLTECCGNHFCLCCIRRLRDERKPCPLCKSPSLAIFPNKERQREIKQLRVRCPLSLPALRGLLLSGRGRESSSDESSAVDNLRIDESSTAANQSGLSNALETATLSKALERCEIVDNVSTKLSTKQPTTERVKQSTDNSSLRSAEHNVSASKVEARDQSTLEGLRDETGDVLQDSGTTSCSWIGELGQVEQHVLDTHGREVLRRIKNEDELQPVAQQQCPVHGQHGHQYGHHRVHTVPNRRNVTFHYVHSPHGGMNLHYHINQSSSFNYSAAVPTAPSSVQNISQGNQPMVHRQQPQSNEMPHSSDLVGIMQSLDNFRSGQDQSSHGSRPISTLATSVSEQIQRPVSAHGEEALNSEEQAIGERNTQGDGTSPATQQSVAAGEQSYFEQPRLQEEELQQDEQHHHVGSNPVVDGQFPPDHSSGHHQQHPRPMFVRRSCPHHHVRGIHGHHMRPHQHHFHHQSPHHGHPPLPHGPSHGRPYYYGPPPRGHHHHRPPHGQGHHHHHMQPHHHHHPHGHHGYHGHHPPP